MRTVVTRSPSFPEAPFDAPLDSADHTRWQVLCGDGGHWRLGIYAPEKTSRDAIAELEQHDCPELFVWLAGRVVLVLGGPDGEREVALEPGRPVLVQAPHAGYCPDGPHTGKALVIERDAFTTVYTPR